MLFQTENKGMLLTICIIILVLCLPAIFYLPSISGDERISVQADAVVINGPYSRVIPRRQIVLVKTDAKMPKIRWRTNGISIGNINIGHFKTTEGKEVLLYLSSKKCPITLLRTKSGEEIYINFRDSARISIFNNLRCQ